MPTDRCLASRTATSRRTSRPSFTRPCVTCSRTTCSSACSRFPIVYVPRATRHTPHGRSLLMVLGAMQVLVPIIVFRNHEVFDPWHDFESSAYINATALTPVIQSMFPVGTHVTVVT